MKFGRAVSVFRLLLLFASLGQPCIDAQKYARYNGAEAEKEAAQTTVSVKRLLCE
ncbi:hypothetical protein TAMA11512_01020 [Selenomonas sp. TAMA-11512]|nr:hypothetical protein TAMA11512_01020 [Selenomonas sp. TAMA-11512]